jgi:hypothetical protein
MPRFVETRIRWMPAVSGVAIAALLLLTAGQAQAATTVYPAGGSTFSGSAEGWTVKSASCNLPILCSASGGYDGADGNSPGSLAANSNFTVDLVSLFKTTVTEQSPEFKVAGSGPSALRLDRQFSPGGLVELAPQVQYTVSLLDQTTGTETKAIGETLSSAAGFAGKEAAVDVTDGHVYSISITAETSSTLAGTSLLAGSTSARFDNVALSVQTSGNNGGGGGSGDNGGNGGEGGNGGNGNGAGLSDSRLLSLLQSSSGGTAILKGKRLFVKGKCSARIGRNCKVSLQGLLARRKPATTRRTSKVGKGKAKTLVLKVKPKAKTKLAKSSRLLFKETVHAGSAQATVYRRLKLIRR